MSTLLLRGLALLRGGRCWRPSRVSKRDERQQANQQRPENQRDGGAHAR